MAKLIPVPFPHMVLNSHDVPPPDYGMLSSWKVAENTPVDFMISNVKITGLGFPGGRVATLIFNSHGSPGKIHIGQGINLLDLSKFQAWNTANGPLIKEIWIVACKVAGKDKASGGVDGESFLRDFALATGAMVTGAVREQKTGTKEIPGGFIDEWEGEVMTFDRKGNKTIRQAENSSHG